MVVDPLFCVGRDVCGGLDGVCGGYHLPDFLRRHLSGVSPLCSCSVFLDTPVGVLGLFTTPLPLDIMHPDSWQTSCDGRVLSRLQRYIKTWVPSPLYLSVTHDAKYQHYQHEPRPTGETLRNMHPVYGQGVH